mgnify:CR=1 FL=1
MSQPSVESYDREFSESDFYDSQTLSDNGCEGCYLLNRGMGGENQLAHMNPGGCLYYYLEEEEQEPEQEQKTPDKIKVKVKRIVACSICSTEKVTDNSDYQTFICESCKDLEERKREIKYQTFIFNKYE